MSNLKKSIIVSLLLISQSLIACEVFRKGPCGNDEHTCTHPGEGGHGYWEKVHEPRDSGRDNSSLLLSQEGISSFFTEMRENFEQDFNNLSDIFSSSLQSDYPDVDFDERSSAEFIRQLQENANFRKSKLQELIEQRSKREKEDSKTLEELKKQAREHSKQILLLLKKQQEHDDKFKNGKIFIPDQRSSNVEEIKLYLDFIKENIEKADAKAPLEEEHAQDISKIFAEINQELEGIQEEVKGIEKCLGLPEKSSRISYKKEEENLKLAKQLIKDLESYQEELCNILVTRRQELNNPALEVAYREVEQRRIEAKNQKAQASSNYTKEPKSSINKWKEEKGIEERQHTKEEANKSFILLLNAEQANLQVAFFLQTIQTGRTLSEEQKNQGMTLLKQVEDLKKKAKKDYRLKERLIDDEAVASAKLLREQIQQHKTELKGLRSLRKQLKTACKFSKEELAACRIRIKQEVEGYQTDSSDEDTWSRTDMEFRRGLLQGVGIALKSAPDNFVESFADLLINPVATIEGIVEGLSKLPEVPGLIFEYLGTIEGNEEAKGAEIAEFITEQLITMLSPNKVKLLSQLAKGKLGKAALQLAEKNGKKLKKAVTALENVIEKILPKEKYFERARNKALEIVGDLGPDAKPVFCTFEKSKAFGKITGRQTADSKLLWRLDYDPTKGLHINIEDIRAGKKLQAKRYVIPIEGDEKLFEILVNNLNK